MRSDRRYRLDQHRRFHLLLDAYGYTGDPTAIRDVVVVRLPELGAAGYQWRIAALDPPQLRVDSSAAAADGGVPGAAGVRLFRVHTPDTGTARVEFDLARSWDAEPAERYRLTIMVE